MPQFDTCLATSLYLGSAWHMATYGSYVKLTSPQVLMYLHRTGGHVAEVLGHIEISNIPESGSDTDLMMDRVKSYERQLPAISTITDDPCCRPKSNKAVLGFWTSSNAGMRAKILTHF